MATFADELIPGLPEELARDCLLRVAYGAFPAVKSVCRLWRKEVESPTFHLFRKSTGVSRTLIAMAQAEHPPATSDSAKSHDPSKPATALSSSSSPFYRVVLLDPAAGEWHTLPPVPSLPYGLPLFCQVVPSSGPSLIVLGGWDPSTWAASGAVWIYDFITGQWRIGAPIPGPPRSFFACASDASRGHVYVAGGHDEEKNALRSALRYDVASDTWERIPDMAAERDESKGVFHSGKFTVLGGYSTENQGQFCRSAETFDPDTSSWGPVVDDALGGSSGTCPRTCLVIGDKMYRCRAGRVEVKGCETGSGAAADWAAAADVPEGARVAPWAVGVGGRHVMVVGSACHGGAHEGYLLHVATGKWQKVDHMPEEYSGHVQAGCCIVV